MPAKHKFQTLLAVALLLPAASFAQSYSINWYKIAGGGGTSSGGSFSLSGTIGQPDAGGTMTGGGYSLTGGFWSLVSVVQSAGSPTLTVSLLGSSVVVSWPAPSTGFILEQASNLAATNWTTSAYTITTNGPTESITISAPTGNLFFRLAQ
jgi:hypothetical protein